MRSAFRITLSLALAGMACATNPVTGGREFTLMSEAQEIQMGQQSDPEVRAEMGVYDDPAMQQYVQDVGMRLARASQRPELPWHFAVVDVPAVTAMSQAGFAPLRGEATRVNGLPAYLGVYEGQAQDGTIARIQAACIGHARQAYFLAGIVRRSKYSEFQAAFDDSLRSFSPIGAEDAARITPNRLAFTTVRRGDTWQGIAERTGGLIPATELAVLNGFAGNSEPPVGQRIKIVIAGE